MKFGRYWCCLAKGRGGGWKKAMHITNGKQLVKLVPLLSWKGGK